MYKKQMIFQRVVCYFVLIASAIVFIYSLGFLTDIYRSLSGAVDPFLSEVDENGNITEYYELVTGASLYYEMQDFNTTLTTVGIGLILASLVLFILCTHSRRKYYIGNLISVIISLVACGAGTAMCLPQIEMYKNKFLTEVNFEELKTYVEANPGSYYTESTFWFDIGYIVFGILIVANILLVVNFVLKLILMKAEKNAIGSRKGAGV